MSFSLIPHQFEPSRRHAAAISSSQVLSRIDRDLVQLKPL
jgi:hypothetical protein